MIPQCYDGTGDQVTPTVNERELGARLNWNCDVKDELVQNTRKKPEDSHVFEEH